MKIYIVQNVARQVEGDLMVVQVEKGYPTRAEAEAHLASAPRQRTEKLKTEAGEIECFCVRGVYEVEVPLPMVDMTSNFDVRPTREEQAKLMEGERLQPAPQFTPEEIAKLLSILKQQPK